MKLITRQTEANKAAASWERQYANGKFGYDKLLILENLKALGKTPIPDEVDEVIGNGSWTRTRCHCCGDDSGVDVVQVGEEPDYESATACICKPCLLKALALFGQ